jgi:hypothetical protein
MNKRERFKICREIRIEEFRTDGLRVGRNED